MTRAVIRNDLAIVLKRIAGEDFEDIEVYRTSGYAGMYHSPSLLRLSRKLRADLPTLSSSFVSMWTSELFSAEVASNGFINFSPSHDNLADSESSSGCCEFPNVNARLLGVVSSSTFIDKWGTPRQGQLAPDSLSTIQLTSDVTLSLTIGLRCVIFWVPHLNRNNPTKAMVRPPKAIGIKVGVFATRSPHRPSPVCMSICTVVELFPEQVVVAGADMTLGTPILNIIPYSQEHHSVEAPTCPSWVAAVKRLPVYWTLASIREISIPVRALVEKALAEDPRSAHSVNRQKVPVHAIKINGEGGPLAVTYQYLEDPVGEFIRVLRLQSHQPGSVGKLRTKQWLEETLKAMPFISQ